MIDCCSQNISANLTLKTGPLPFAMPVTEPCLFIAIRSVSLTAPPPSGSASLMGLTNQETRGVYGLKQPGIGHRPCAKTEARS